ncbi:hypothetical protein [Vibrio parahaemolyticus]|uniref:hypothetical protein n=1 Tax=Vibrio parahaemolyticus TaxID=670 RepID=UPI00111FE83E|nr:hypothetical protein [Vibrio parahaemolyticus]EGQ8037356.1 hypothetical protein [Vibrio parahaemolyticus]EHH2497979.1 hypothetical protein [Vibrio parahaemolyticus]EHR0874457.1 hypothetical protein [Vibrio parahaemolyticus]EID4326801.1 hypothetical protein [Vibrio parahaemolyticus]EKA7408825.1 hypothetical protein [Vibrio parahaemolyticus]
MRSEVIEGLTEKFGPPSRKTKKVMAWHMSTKYGVVLQLDSPASGEYASVWLPEDEPELLSTTMDIKLYSEDKGRHSNTHQTPGLEKGLAVMRAKVTNQQELDELLEYLVL